MSTVEAGTGGIGTDGAGSGNDGADAPGGGATQREAPRADAAPADAPAPDASGADPAPAAAPRKDATRHDLPDEDLIDLERELLRPSTRASEERLRELLAPDLMIIGSVGQVWDLDDTIAALASERPAERLEVEDPAGYAVRPLGTGVRQVTYETRRPDGVRVRRNSIWTWSGSHWRMAYHQGTPVP